ncbi:armadillo-type protein [Xylariaceae sp. FL0804]|nr:armadillo-type protein [Xylariaceae sp. FL0804]
MGAQTVNGSSAMGAEGTAGPVGMEILPRIHEALEVVYSPYSSNDTRQEAQSFLENVKNATEAPSHGFQLASDKNQSPVVRHYALSLLEHAIKHKWATYSQEEAAALRSWVLQLSQNLSREDPPYLRNKTALLWVEVAKRCWAAEWMDMDQLLVQLWQIPDSAVHKELVMVILEMLSDDIFNGDDPVVGIREGILSKASVEIFTPAAVLTEAFPNREAGPDVRCGEEGWLGRITQLLGQCLSGDVQGNGDLRSCAVRGLAVIYALMPWVIPKAVAVTGCVPVMCDGLQAANLEVQKAALEAMHALYARTSLNDQEFLELVVPLYEGKYVDLLSQLFDWSSPADPDDIDDDKYQFCKKLSELVSFLGNYMDRRFFVLPSDPQRVNFRGFLQLLLSIAQSRSLVISIPTLVTWTRLLNHRALGPSIAGIAAFVGPLLELCGSRLIRYESFPEDTQDPTFLFLLEDTDTIPERHAFLGNYRRYSCQVIECIVQLKMSDAMEHILGQTENILGHLYDNTSGFDMATYSKSSQPVLRVDAQATVIEAALRGFGKWRTKLLKESLKSGQTHEAEVSSVENTLESWCSRLLAMKLEDPLIRKRVLQLLVAFSTSALENKPDFMLKVLEHILMNWPTAQPEYRLYTDAIKDLQSESMVELQRLAAKMPDHLLDVYDQIDVKVKDMIASGTLDQKRQITYQTFLFTIIHRSTRLDQNTKVREVKGYIDAVKSQWEDARLKQAVSTHEGFCELMALDKAQRYVARTRMHEIQDWGSVDLDAEGQALQAELEERQSALPLRVTKSFLTCSTEKIENDAKLYELSSALWQDGFTTILPELLQLLDHAHASHSPDNWTALPPEMRSIVGRVLTDRFWQAGISEGSKEDFYARVLEKKHTLEGLASTIRGSIRYVREACYAIIYYMSRLDKIFYGFGELPAPLARSLLAQSSGLSAHQLINLLNLVRYLVDNCPVQLREQFLPPILATCFRQMDARIHSEWEKLERQQGVKTAGDALTEEMKSESILRQLTHTSVMMVADFLDPGRKNAPEGSADAESLQKYPTLRTFCLSHIQVAETLLVFCTHTIRFRDSRCCGIMLKVFRSIIPDFITTEHLPKQSSSSMDAETTSGGDAQAPPSIPADTAVSIREYISSEVVKACIESINEAYFVDLQKDLAALLAAVLVGYGRVSSTARDVLVSLPNVDADEVDRSIAWMAKSGVSSRSQRGAVLELLRDLKGVSISEMGKVSKSVVGPGAAGAAGAAATAGPRTGAAGAPSSSSTTTTSKRPPRSKMAQKFMTAPTKAGAGQGGDAAGLAGQGQSTGDIGDGLDGVASLFDL